MNLEEGEIVMCKVTRIEGTTVFLDIEGGNEGTMIFSEVSPGRIRNIRDYIAINKRIVCKILEIKGNRIHLSLRRVTAKERDSLLETLKKEKMLENMLRPVLKDKTSSALEKIKSSYEPSEFLDEARENPELLKKISSGAQLEQLKKIFSEKKDSEKKLSSTITLKSSSSDGLEKIKKTLAFAEKEKNSEIHYLGSSKFSVAVKSKDFKTAKHELEGLIEKIKSEAKKNSVSITIKEK